MTFTNDSRSFPERMRAALLLFVLMGLGAFGRTAAAQQTTNVIYDDARSARWYESTWGCAGGGQPGYDFNQTAVVASGQKALLIDHTVCGGGWGAFGFDHRDANWKTYTITPASGDVLTFKFNAGAETADDAGVKITINNGNGNDQLIARYLPSPVQPNTWYDVTIPLLDLVKTPAAFSRLFLFNFSNERPRFYLDDLKVVQGGSPAQIPPVISGVQVTHVGPDTARVVWATDKQAKFTFRHTVGGQVIARTFDGFATQGQIVVRDLAPQTTYAYEIEALAQGADPTKPGATSKYNGTFTTIARDLTPPTVSDVVVERFPNHVNVTWTTDEPATSRIEYGAGALTQTVSDAALKTTHRLSIPGLAAGATYQFRAGGADEQQNTGWSAVASFTTLEAPAAGNVQAIYGDALAANWLMDRWACATNQPAYNPDQSAVVSAGQKAIEIRHVCPGGWGAVGFDHRKADWTEKFYMYPNPGDAFVFRFNPGPAVGDEAGLQLMLDLGELAANKNLADYLPNPMQPDTWYTVTVPLTDLMTEPTRFFRIYFFNDSPAQPHYFLDEMALAWTSAATPPAFTSAGVTHAGPDSVRLAWTTDKQARYTLRYTIDGQETVQAFPDYAASGSFVLRNLTPSTGYPYTIEAVAYGADPSDPAAVGVHTGTATTTEADQVPPTFSDVQTQVFATHVIVTWTTHEPADSRIEYGPAGYTQSLTEAPRTMNHRLVVTGLVPSTTYQFRLGGADLYGNLGWYEPVPAATFTTTAAPTTTLTVDAGVFVRPFRDGIRGQGLANWASYYNRPYANDAPKLMEMTRLIRPGIVRYAGGLWSNNMMWSRENLQYYPSGMKDTNGDGTPDTYKMRTHLDPSLDGVDRCGAAPVAKPGAYNYVMQAEEMDRLAAFARYVGAEVMIEVDVTTCDPEMWADMVRYVNVEKDYGFKYWELGNEFDLERKAGKTDIPIGPAYVSRFKRYHDVLKAVDPTIRISGPTTASHDLTDHDFRPYEDFINPLTADAEVRSRDMLGAFTFHYYPFWKNLSWGANPTYHDLLNYDNSIPKRARSHVPEMLGSFRELLDSRGFEDVPIAITEFNSVAADDYTPLTYNHANALFMADMLGRLAYNGADEIAHWLLFDKASVTSYGILDHNESSIHNEWNGNIVVDDKFTPNPVYYTFLMYGQLFGDQLVQSSSASEDRLSIWASTDTDEPGALKLIVTNTGDEALRATVNLNGVTIQTARSYEMGNPRWVAATDKDAVKDGTTINGLAIDATSAQTILASARAIMASGRPVEADGSSFTMTFQPYSAVAILINAADVVIADMPALEPPVLRDPVPGNLPELRWEAASRAHTYTVQVSADPAFGSFVVDRPNVTEARFKVQGLTAGVTYYARVRSAVMGETSAWSPVQSFTTAGVVARAAGQAEAAALAQVEEAAPVVGEFELSGAYPNPFNPQTSFSLRLKTAQHLRVDVFDAIGRKVATLYDGHAEAAHAMTFTFDAGHLASGLYLYRITGETFAQTGRMMLLK